MSTPPDDICDIADIISFKNTMFIIIITSIDPYILHQPLKISFVLRLPPIANASGAKNVSTDVITYLSPISKRSFTICIISTTPTIMTSSHFAPAPSENILSFGVTTFIDDGSSSRSITVPVIVSPISQICLDASRRNENTKVLRNTIFGSSASKPAADIIAFSIWNTRFPMRSAQPSATNTFTISSITGAVSRKY